MTDALRAQAKQAYKRWSEGGQVAMRERPDEAFLAGYKAATQELALVAAERDAALGEHRSEGLGDSGAMCRCGWCSGDVGSTSHVLELWRAHVREMAAREVNREH